MARLTFFLAVLTVARLAVSTPVPDPAPLSFSEYVEAVIMRPDVVIDPEYAINLIHADPHPGSPVLVRRSYGKPSYPEFSVTIDAALSAVFSTTFPTKMAGHTAAIIPLEMSENAKLSERKIGHALCDTDIDKPAAIIDVLHCLNILAYSTSELSVEEGSTHLCTYNNAMITAECKDECPQESTYRNIARGVARIMDECHREDGMVQGQSLAFANGMITIHVDKP